MIPPNHRSLLAKRSHPPGFNSQTSNQPKSFSHNTNCLTDSFPASHNNPWSAFRTQEWFNLARDNELHLCRTPPLVSFLDGWLQFDMNWMLYPSEKRSRSIKLIIHLHLLQMLRLRWTLLTIPYTFSWRCAQAQGFTFVYGLPDYLFLWSFRIRFVYVRLVLLYPIRATQESSMYFHYILHSVLNLLHNCMYKL
jgi:hypothetical protein